MIHVYGSLTAAEPGARRVEATLVPYGEAGGTSAGVVTVTPGVIALPAAPEQVVLNMEHDRRHPLGRATALTEHPDRLAASFTVARTPAGDAYLAEVAEGLRPGVSVELDGVVIRDGRLLAGVLTHVGAVVAPAFPSALVASDQGTLTATEQEPTVDPEDLIETAPTVVTPDPIPVYTGEAYHASIDGAEVVPIVLTPVPAEDAEQVAEQIADQGGDLTASRPTPRRPARAPQGSGVRPGARSRGLADAFRLIADAHASGGSPAQLTAALADVTYNAGTVSGRGNTVVRNQWLGELWGGVDYQQRWQPLLGSGELTSMKAEGWRTVVRATVKDWSGDKTQISGTAPTFEKVTTTASRIAGGLDVDRALIDFGEVDVVEMFYRQMAESLAMLLDAKALAAILATAAAGDEVPGGEVPEGANSTVSLAAARIVDGALAVYDAIHTIPTFALTSVGDYRTMLLEREFDALKHLSTSFGLNPTEGNELASITVVPTPDIEDGEPVVGHSSALRFFTLPGAPLRMSAEDVARGGYDQALFAYWATLVEKPEGIVQVTTPAP